MRKWNGRFDAGETRITAIYTKKWMREERFPEKFMIKTLQFLFHDLLGGLELHFALGQVQSPPSSTLPLFLGPEAKQVSGKGGREDRQDHISPLFSPKSR